MYKYNEREIVRGVLKQWLRQYPVREHKSSKWAFDASAVYSRLCALDLETATYEDVDKAMGTRGWAGPPTCDECNTKTWNCVQLGEKPNYDSATANICIDCLRKAIALCEE